MRMSCASIRHCSCSLDWQHLQDVSSDEPGCRHTADLLRRTRQRAFGPRTRHSAPDRCGSGRRGDDRPPLGQAGRMQEIAMARKLPPVHPGEVLREEFLVPLELTPYAVAAALNVPRTRIERIAREEKPVTADTALRLGKFFRTGAAFWMNIQARFDLETAEDVLAPQIRKIASYKAA